MDPNYGRLWDRTFEAYDPNVLRTRRHKHPIVEKWLSDDARAEVTRTPTRFTSSTDLTFAPQFEGVGCAFSTR